MTMVFLKQPMALPGSANKRGGGGGGSSKSRFYMFMLLFLGKSSKSSLKYPPANGWSYRPYIFT